MSVKLRWKMYCPAMHKNSTCTGWGVSRYELITSQSVSREKVTEDFSRLDDPVARETFIYKFLFC
jgi:hypothetical protein